MTRTAEGSAVVATHCMYPSNSLVRVTVEGGEESFIVREEGGALDEAAQFGIDARIAALHLKHIVELQGLKISNGVIYSPLVPVEQVPATVMLVANCSKEAAHRLVDHHRPRRPQNFLELLARLLDELYYGRVEHDVPVTGASNKVHKFRHVIRIGEERRLIVDPVINESSAINARVLANLDVSQREEGKVIQRVFMTTPKAGRRLI